MQDAPKCPVHKISMAAATHWIKTSSGPFPKPIHCRSWPAPVFLVHIEG
jgi:hypothetical protein